MVEVAVGGGGQLQGSEADVVQSLVVDAERLVRVLDKLVDGQGGVVRFHHCVRHLVVVKQVIKHLFQAAHDKKSNYSDWEIFSAEIYVS